VREDWVAIANSHPDDLNFHQIIAGLFKAVDRSKAIIHTYLAWQDEPGRPMGPAITKQALQPDTNIARSFTSWLIQLFK
jgi:hypothetical protein